MASLQTRTALCYPPLVVSAVRRVRQKHRKEEFFTTENTEGTEVSENFRARRTLRISVRSSELRERVVRILSAGRHVLWLVPAKEVEERVYYVEAVTRPLVS